MRVYHRLRARPALSTGLVVLVVAFAALATILPPRVAALLAWNAGVVAYLARLGSAMFRATPESIRRRAALLDEGQWGIFSLVVGAAVASLVAILLDLAASRGTVDLALHAVLAAATILLSWTFVHTVFGQHYAHLWFLAKDGGLLFPGTAVPGYIDFLYFSFVIGMTFQVSDVQVTTPLMRRLVLVHGIVAFLFNTIILALSVNLAAGLA
jgi:uncharacterized membrane protein